MKKAAKVLFSMRTAMIILLLLIAACVIGSVLPQGEIRAYYEGYYPETLASIILLCDFDDVFHSIWFAVLTVFLCLNLLGCNLIHAPGLVRRLKNEFTPENSLKRWDGKTEVVLKEDPGAFFEKMGFRKVEKTQTADEREYHYAVRYKIGICGAWLTHLGMLIIIVGFALGQIFTVKYTVYGVPGTSKPIGDTGLIADIDSFEMTLRADDTVEQYTSQVTIRNEADGTSETGITSVNHPAKIKGMKVYQNSTGWAANVTVTKSGELLQEGILCAGEHMKFADNENLVMAFNSFYPDYVDYGNGPTTQSGNLNNPAYLYTLYYQGELLGMNVLMAGQEITIDAYTITFNDPQQYTLIQFKDDPFTWIALIGGLVIMAALFLAFYLRTEELWAVKRRDGRWLVAGRSRKGGVLYQEKILDTFRELSESSKTSKK